MKKETLMRIQKVVCYAFLIATFALLVCSFCFFDSTWSVFTVNKSGSTNFYATKLLGTSVVFQDRNEAVQFYVYLWQDIQTANDMLFYTSIVGFVSFAAFAIFGGVGRRHYYKSNLITGIIVSVTTIAMSVVSLITSLVVAGEFSQIGDDLEKYYEIANKQLFGGATVDIINRGHIALGIVVPVLYIICACLFLVFVIYKFKATKVSTKKEVAANGQN